MLNNNQKRFITGGCFMPDVIRKKHNEIINAMAKAIFEADEDIVDEGLKDFPDAKEMIGPRAKWEDQGETQDGYRYRAAKALQASGFSVTKLVLDPAS